MDHIVLQRHRAHKKTPLWGKEGEEINTRQEGKRVVEDIAFFHLKLLIL